MTSRRSRQTRTLEAPPRPPAARALSATLGLLPHPGQMCWLPQYELRSGEPGFSHRQIRRTPVRGSDRVARKRTGVHSTSWISDPCEGRPSQATGPRSGAQRTHFSRHECHFLVSYSETQ